MTDCAACWGMRSITRGRVRRCRWCVAEQLATVTAPTPTRAPIEKRPKVPERINPGERPPPTRPYRCAACGESGHRGEKCPRRLP